MHKNTSRQTGTHNFILHENKVHVTKHQNKDSLYIVDFIRYFDSISFQRVVCSIFYMQFSIKNMFLTGCFFFQ
ncbi:hypothetical protein BPUM_3034 [Bacillus pumilus SAFR-032]|uniref:Uncharacterized protein n=1 Tax=Bacillus pumilus (strain SAFR-032) TaxID=315750 RepID=A8FHH1_BACP2|nr:hypothetical protein BPUM_3034 [Bacillus pumilus SAFR-032]